MYFVLWADLQRNVGFCDALNLHVGGGSTSTQVKTLKAESSTVNDTDWFVSPRAHRSIEPSTFALEIIHGRRVGPTRVGVIGSQFSIGLKSYQL